MQQSSIFVPVRLAFAFMAILFVAVVTPEASTSKLYADNQELNPGIDRIVTGETVNTGELDQWKARKAKYDKCGLCGEMQAFPADLPE